MSSIDESKKFVPLDIAVLTISDTRSLADDKSGTTLSERLTAAGHRLAAREIVVDDVEAIRIIIKKWIADPDVDAIITTGGTGFTGRDGWDGILAAQLDYRTRPCNFVEIMPRLDEHLRRPKAKGASA